MQAGDHVVLTIGSRVFEAVILMASANGDSLMLQIDGAVPVGDRISLGGWLPVLRQADGTWIEIFAGQAVDVRPMAPPHQGPGNLSPGFYARDPGGQYHAVRPAGEIVAVHICRRLADFPDGRQPAESHLTTCTECRAPVVTDGRLPGQPIVCMQCADIEPLPIERPS